jgi:hypothetical protein
MPGGCALGSLRKFCLYLYFINFNGVNRQSFQKYICFVNRRIDRIESFCPIDKLSASPGFGRNCVTERASSSLPGRVLQSLLLVIQKIVKFLNQFHEFVVILLFGNPFAKNVHAFSFFRGHGASRE